MISSYEIEFVGGCKFVLKVIGNEHPYSCEFLYIEIDGEDTLCIWKKNIFKGENEVISCPNTKEYMELFRHCQGPLRCIHQSELPAGTKIEQ